VEQVKQHLKYAANVIMMMTPGRQRGDLTLCGELGIGACLSKPLRRAELHQAMTRILQSKEEPSPAAVVTASPPRDQGNDMKSLHVLVAEDNPVNQKLAIVFLTKRGHRVVLATTGEEALAALARQSFDLVLMDVHMPGTDGIQATIQIREQEKVTGLHQPVVAMTALAMKGDRERCIAAGMDHYISKPIDLRELDDLLAFYAGRP
jgi:two-component system sensor histidine kinase/response regulator